MIFPLKMKENRVWRLYYGGKLIDKMRGYAYGDGEDGNFPEDWLASVVVADNPDRADKPEKEGLSKIETEDGSELYLKDLIDSDPETYLGEKHIEKFGVNFGVLTKFLDSAERLPIQVHPTKDAAKRLFNSDYGKTESWYILDSRVIDGEEPYILLGFKKTVTAEKWKELFDKQDMAEMQEYMHKIVVKPGDVFLITGGTPHAIGSGCMLLEVQEPTDYTISVEKCDMRGNLMPDHLCHMGLGFEKMFECFTYEDVTKEELLGRYALTSNTLEEGDGYKVESLITYRDTTCFALNRYTVEKTYERKNSGRACCIAITKGSGVFKADGKVLEVKAGDCLFEPAKTVNYIIEANETLEVLECMPPEM